MKKKAISTLMATILIIVVTLVAGLAVMSYTLGWFRTTQVATLDASGSRAYVDLASGKGMMHMVIRNTGTGDARVASIDISGITSANITFVDSDSAQIKWGAKTLDGSMVGSSGVGIDSAKNLLIPSGGQVSIKFDFDGTTNDITDIFDVGVKYRGIIVPPAGGGATTDFSITPESY